MSTEDDSVGVNTNTPTVASPDEHRVLDDENDEGVDVSEKDAADLKLDTTAFNLVEQLSKTPEGIKYLDELSDIVFGSFKSMWESTEDYREKRRTLYKLFRGHLDPKSDPYENCANIHLPVVLRAIVMLVPRIVTEIFPSDDYMFKAIPTGPEDQDRSDMLTLHGDWQFKHQMPDFIPMFERLITETLLAGSGFVYSCRDFINDRNKHEFLSCEEFVMAYTDKSVDPSLSDVPEKIRIVRKNKHELEDLIAKGSFDPVVMEEIMEPTNDPKIRGNKDKTDQPQLTVKEEVDEVEGHHRPEDDPTAPWIFYEYHGWLQLPGEDKQRPVVVIADTDRKKVVSFYVREQDDWKDKERFDQEQQAATDYIAAMQQFQQQQNDPNLMLSVAQGVAPPPMPPPTDGVKLDETGQPLPPDPVKKVPVEYFTKLDCIYDPHGSMGIGVGDMVVGFNQVANQLGNLFIDAASTANNPPQLVSENALPPGTTTIAPGDIIRSPLPPEQLDKAHKVLNQVQGNPQLIEMMNIMMQVANEVAATPDVYAGEPGKANETFRGISTRVEQAAKPLTAIALRMLRGLTVIIKKNAALNANFLPESEMVSVIDPMKGRSKITVTRAMYLEDYDITFTADTRFVSQSQKLDEDMQLMQFGATSPLMMANRFQQQVFLYEVATRYLKDMKRPELVPYLGARPTPPPPPQPIPPHEENAGFLSGKSPAVNPADDDALHVADHTAFLKSPEGQFLDKQQKDNLEQHTRNHVAQHIMKAAQAGGLNGGNARPGGAGGLALPPGNPGNPPTPPS
jgi:hypothetical protein